MNKQPKILYYDIEFDIKPHYKVFLNSEGSVTVQSFSKHKKGKFLTPQYLNGYQRYKINNRYIMSHRLISGYLWGSYDKNLVVNHIDGNKLNNSVGNLELCTIAENIAHAIKLGLHVSSDPTRSGRYKDGRCADIKKYKKDWYLKNKDRILNKLRQTQYAAA